MDELFGKILTGNEGRDAFHQPIIPLIVDSENTKPGDWVKKIKDSSKKVCSCLKSDKNCIGYIDPYIDSEYIPVGSKVFIFLKQGLIDNMRHHWTSPFFEDDDIQTEPETFSLNISSAETTLNTVDSHLTDSQKKAKAWLEEICYDNRLRFNVFENASSVTDIYDEIKTYVDLNVNQGEGTLEDSVDEIYKNFAMYKNIQIDGDEDDLFYIDWDCMGCN